MGGGTHLRDLELGEGLFEEVGEGELERGERVVRVHERVDGRVEHDLRRVSPVRN